jgi:peptidoglycan-associated lipoprotein
MEEPGFGSSGLSRSTAPGAEGFRVIYFDFDDATLRADAKDALRFNADVLRAEPEVAVEIQGHCDERGSEEYNLALGQRRAESARRYLVDMGIKSGRLSTQSYGESMPAVRGHDESAWSKNRRGEFVRAR